MRQTSIGFKHKGLSLEGVISLPDSRLAPFPGVVVCHPHPLFGGDMENAVVVTLCKKLAEMDFGTLRFNFRGVGKSEGTFTNGREEKEDIKAAIKVLKNWPGINRKRLGIIGYSFGASVILGGLTKLKDISAIALVAPPVSAIRGSAIIKDKRHKFILAGENDKIAPPEQLKKALYDFSNIPLEFLSLPKADHSLTGHQVQAASVVTDFILRVL